MRYVLPKIMLECFREFEKQGVQDMQGVNQMFAEHANGKNAKLTILSSYAKISGG